MEISGNCGNGGAFWGVSSGNFLLFFLLFLTLHGGIDLFLEAEKACGSWVFHFGQAADGMDVLGTQESTLEIGGGALIENAQTGAEEGRHGSDLSVGEIAGELQVALP